MRRFGHKISSRTKLTLLMATTILVVAICLAIYFYFSQPASIDYSNLSVQQLVSNGYYVYLLPESHELANDWKSTLSMYSFDWHCTASDSQWNPVNISYTASLDERLDIDIFYAGNPFYDDTQLAEIIPINAEWIPSGDGHYYVAQSGDIRLKITDTFGNEVVVISALTIGKIVELISELNYIGPDPKDIGNPWENACK